MDKDLIIISAFISNINNNNRAISKYIEYGKILMGINYDNLYKVIFIEKTIYNEYFNTENINLNTYYFIYDTKQYEYFIKNKIIFVFFEKINNYLYDYINTITNFNINTDNHSKDTLEYIFVQCHKTEWVKIAIHLIAHIKTINIIYFNNIIQHFMWIDFFIYHVINDNILFNKLFKQLYNGYYNDDINKTNSVRIGSCIHPNNTTYQPDIYKNIAWYFAGGVFGGNSDSLLLFADLMKKKCINIIQEKNNLMWEVNIWYLLYSTNPELFNLYECNHNSSIIENYCL